MPARYSVQTLRRPPRVRAVPDAPVTFPDALAVQPTTHPKPAPRVIAEVLRRAGIRRGAA
jgi:hypothetical protein